MVDNLDDLGAIPPLLALLRGTLGAAATVHGLVTSVRRRRPQFAVLRAIGFTPRQVAGSVTWQAVVVTGLALVAGVPIGVLAGRELFARVADGIGVVVDPWCRCSHWRLSWPAGRRWRCWAPPSRAGSQPPSGRRCCGPSDGSRSPGFGSVQAHRHQRGVARGTFEARI